MGKLAKVLRLLGYDTVFFAGENDTHMVNQALAEKRIILTRDTHIMERHLVTTGRIKAVLIQSDAVEDQIQQVTSELDLLSNAQPFTLCLECNQPLEARRQEDVQGRVPPYVWKTQNEYVECPRCHRLYWKGTHWEAMTKKLARLSRTNTPGNGEGK